MVDDQIRWMNDQLFRGNAVVTNDFYLDQGQGKNRTSTFAAQIELPEVQHAGRFMLCLEQYIAMLCQQLIRVRGSVIDTDLGEEYEFERAMNAFQTRSPPVLSNVVWETKHIENRIIRHYTERKPAAHREETTHNFTARFYFGWVNKEDRQKDVAFRTLRYLMFPAERESVLLSTIKKYMLPPFNLRIPMPVDPLEDPTFRPTYSILSQDKEIIAAFPYSIEHQRVFIDAANAHLEYDSKYTTIETAYWLLNRLERAAEKAADTLKFMKQDSEVDLPVLG